MTDELVVRQLRSDDDRTEFSSGQEDLDRFFHQYAGQNQFLHHLGATYIAVEQHATLGFLTVSAASIEVDDLPRSVAKGMPHYPLPVLRIARIAVDRSAQGRGVGKALLRAALEIALNMAEQVGCVGIVVDAKPEAIGFYERYGFLALDVLEGQLEERPIPQVMFLPLGSIPSD